MSPLAIVLLVAAVALLVAAEWARVGKLSEARQRRERSRRKSHLQVVGDESEDFARSVERDLAALPTIDEQDAKRR